MATLRLKSNPFATRFVAPGRLPWIGQGSESVETITDRFQRKLACRAAIVGPHGSGKSTLLEHLIPRLGQVCYRQASGSEIHQDPDGNVIWIQLRRAWHPTKQLAQSRATWRRNRLLVLDGFEQLSRAMRLWTMADTWRRGLGLLVTCHHRVPLATLYRTQITLDTVQAIVAAALANQCHRQEDAGVGRLPTDHRPLLEELQERHGSNVREILMELYDRVAIDGGPSWAQLDSQRG